MNIISEYVAPWALAKEKVPIHFVWEEEPSLKKIIITIPDDFLVDELLNAKDCVQKGSKIMIPIECLETPNYFGITVCSKNIYDQPMILREIKVQFFSADKTLIERTLNAKIVRPFIEIVKAPKKVIVTDKTDIKKLFNLSITHSGFGSAEITLKALSHNRTISKVDSLYYEILRELIEDGMEALKTGYEKADSYSDDISINEEEIHKIASDLIIKLEKHEIPPDMKDEVLQDIEELLKDDKSKEKLLQTIYSKVRRLVVASVLHFLDKYPHEDIELSFGNIKTTFQTDIKQLIMHLNYNDSMGNKYQQLEKMIEVEDNRTNKKKVFDVPINIEWNTEKFVLNQVD